MGAVRGEKVYEGPFVAQVVQVVSPAPVRGQPSIACGGVERLARFVQGRVSDITATGDVDRAKVERQAHQVV